tara:strand:+ start:562 stop:1131 length:570 start_codon:yes stop_codon:yes gene_type:complete
VEKRKKLPNIKIRLEEEKTGRRQCRICAVYKPLSTEFFTKKTKSEKHGGYVFFYRTCIVCERKQAAKKRATPAYAKRMKELQRAYALKNKDKIRAYAVKWCEQNPEKLKRAQEKQNLQRRTDPEYKEKVRQYYYAHMKKKRLDADYYFKARAAEGTRLKTSEIPQGLIEVKRAHILLQREIKKKEKENK